MSKKDFWGWILLMGILGTPIALGWMGINYYLDRKCLDIWSAVGREPKVVRHECMIKDNSGNYVHAHDFRENYRRPLMREQELQ